MKKPNFSAKGNGQSTTFSRVLRLTAPNRLYMMLSILASAVSVAGQLGIPILAGRAIDAMIGAGRVDFPGVWTVLLQIAALTGISALGQWLSGVCNNRITYSVSRNLRDTAIRKIQLLPLSYLDSHPAGDLLSRVVADVDLFSDGLLMGFTQFFSGVLMILGTLAFMISVNLTIALIVCCVTPLSLAAAAFIARRTYRYFNEQTAARGSQTALINERIEGVRVVQAFGHEQANLNDFDETNRRLSRASLKAIFYSSIVNPSTRFINNVVYAGVALASALAAIGGGVTVGELSCLLTYATQFAKPFNEITGVVTEMQNALSCAARVFDFLDAEDQSPDAETALTLRPEAVDGRVTLQDVRFQYVPEKELIRDFSLTVQPGQRVAIVGPTGCGKTTLINLLMRFYDVNGGCIAVSGTDIRQITRRSLRQSYGMVLQDTWLRSGTVHDNIAYGKPDATRDEVIAAAKAAHAHGFISRLPQGYDTVIGEDGDNISQGQKQLLCIARVMLCLPPMLILDEATSSIDTRTEIRIQKAFATMMRGRTSFIVAHRLSTIREADVILVMRDGQIVEKGTHDALLARNGFYAQLYNSQFEGVAI
ncbi:MAG TPA: ABC transporter ATP-binding protein [Candidatus Limiplasma sp.]|nr:ABC transporter ATP-binding protein [Candidatus Limiplasma sp.]